MSDPTDFTQLGLLLEEQAARQKAAQDRTKAQRTGQVLEPETSTSGPTVKEHGVPDFSSSRQGPRYPDGDGDDHGVYEQDW